MQGFNMGRYVPPDAEGVLTANQASRKGHALGARAARLRTEGTLTVRFEMPFAVWCDHCRPHPALIGQGVRFNADKKRVGSYFSSPVYSFRVRHPPCGGAIEIRTDPQNTAYVVVSGGRRRDTGDDHHRADDESLVGSGALLVPAAAAGEREGQRETAFSNLEKTIADRAALAAATERIDEIEGASARQWDDPYARNQALRRAFRVGRRQRERDEHVAEELRDRMGLGIELLPESDEDARWARLVDFGSKPEGDRDKEEKVLARPLFGAGKKAKAKVTAEDKTSNGSGKTPKRLKSEVVASKMRESLVSEIVDNTRMASDPFLEPRSKDSTKSAALLPGLKRKRGPEREPSPPPDARPADKVAVVSSALVDYDSD